MLSLQGALEAAGAFLVSDCSGWNPSTMRLMYEGAYVDREQAVVPYNTIEFLDGGRERKQLLGNRPVIVELATGACRYMTLDEIINELKDPEEL